MRSTHKMTYDVTTFFFLQNYTKCCTFLVDPHTNVTSVYPRTLFASRKFVTMTIRLASVCQTMLQKSTNVDLVGPRNKLNHLSTHHGPKTHIHSCNWVTTGSYKGVSPVRCRASRITYSGLLSDTRKQISKKFRIKFREFDYKRVPLSKLCAWFSYFVYMRTMCVWC